MISYVGLAHDSMACTVRRLTPITQLYTHWAKQQLHNSKYDVADHIKSTHSTLYGDADYFPRINVIVFLQMTSNLLSSGFRCIENLFKRQNHIQYHIENVLRKYLSRKLLGTRHVAVNTLVRASLILCNKTGRLLTMKISRCDLYKPRRRHTRTSVTRLVRHTSAVLSLIVAQPCRLMVNRELKTSVRVSCVSALRARVRMRGVFYVYCQN